jgi:hypothetical protein
MGTGQTCSGSDDPGVGATSNISTVASGPLHALPNDITATNDQQTRKRNAQRFPVNASLPSKPQ